MKIGLVTGEYPPMQGGVGAYTQELAKALAAQDHEVHIFTSRKARPAGTSRSLNSLYQPNELPYGFLHPRARRWHWRDIGLLADTSARYGLDVVNIQYQAAAYNMRHPAINFVPFRLNGMCKTVATFHDLRTPYLFPKAAGLRQWVVERLAKTAHGTIVTNRADEASLKGLVTNLVRIPIGSNIPVYPAGHREIEQVRSDLGLKSSDFLLGYFGFLNESKGADDLVEALAKLPAHMHLAFIGGRTGASDPNNNESFAAGLERLIAKHGLTGRVHFTDFLPEEATSHYLAAIELMVMPYRDGASLRRGTLMAALAHGRPIITTMPEEATPELNDSAGVELVPRADVGALVEAICALAGDRDKRSRLGEQAQIVARSFDWKTIARRTAEFFETL